VTFIILCTYDLYVMYVDPLKKYDQPQFAMFNDLVQNVCDAYTGSSIWSHRLMLSMQHFNSMAICSCCIRHVPLWV